MKITFLGSGSFFAGPKNYHSNLLLETSKGHRLLLDCGSDIRFSLGECGYKPTDIHGVYVSHLHDDHVGGLEWLGYATYYSPKQRRPELIVPKGMMTDLWEHRLAVSMETLSEQTATLETYFKPFPIERGFTFDGITAKLVPVVHVVNHFSGHMISYGLFMNINGVKVYWTSDMAYPKIPLADGVWDFEKHWENYESADFIFHDCETINTSDVHPHYELLKKFPDEIKRKMWLYHTQAASQPDARVNGFLGIVRKGQSFKF
jgi:ribonuclease BN (tRNA processing enzyme)